MSHCRIEGCSNAAVAKELCAKHYMRVRRTGEATAKHKPGPKPKPGGKGEAMASLQAEIARLKAESDVLCQRIAGHVAEIAPLKTRRVAEAGRPRAERHRVTKHETAGTASLLTRIETLEAGLARERLEHNATRGLYRRALGAHKGFLTRAEYRQILACLHPGGVSGERAKRHEEAFKRFTECEKLFIKKGERAVRSTSDEPRVQQQVVPLSAAGSIPAAPSAPPGRWGRNEGLSGSG